MTLDGIVPQQAVWLTAEARTGPGGLRESPGPVTAPRVTG